MIPRLRRLVATVACLAPAVLAGSAAVAQAAPPAGSTAQPDPALYCPAQTVTHPFAAWGDPDSYALAPGGDFESTAWTLSNGAALIAGSEPFAATGTLGASSLSLPAGGVAQSPTVCIDAGSPSLRFFVAGTGNVQVQAVYNGSVYPLGVARAGGAWAPSPIINTRGAVFARQAGGPALVNLQFVALNGSPQVDDVFIDPWNRT